MTSFLTKLQIIKILRYDFVKKLIESQNAQTIVDLGCAGNGTETSVLKQIIEHCSNMFGIQKKSVNLFLKLRKDLFAEVRFFMMSLDFIPKKFEIFECSNFQPSTECVGGNMLNITVNSKIRVQG